MRSAAQQREVDRLLGVRNRLVRHVQEIEDRLRELGVEESVLVTPPKEERRRPAVD